MSYRSVVLADNPVAYYRFEPEATGVNETGDASHDMTYSGVEFVYDEDSAVYQSSQFARSAVSFGKAFSSNFNIVQDATIEVWARYTTMPSNDLGILVSRAGGSPNRQFLFGTRWQGAGAWMFELRFSDDTVRVVSSASALNNGEWHHIVGVRRGTNMELWVDGILDSTMTCPALDGKACTIPFELFEYGDGAYSSYRYRGDSDEIAVYDYALTGGQILNHYEQRLATGFELRGTAKVNSQVQPCRLKLYDDQLGLRLTNTTSDENGVYTFDNLFPERTYMIVCQTDIAGICPQVAGPFTPSQVADDLYAHRVQLNAPMDDSFMDVSMNSLTGVPTGSVGISSDQSVSGQSSAFFSDGWISYESEKLSLTSSSIWTVEGWFFVTDLSRPITGIFFNGVESNTDRCQFEIKDNGHVNLYLQQTTGTGSSISSSPGLVVEQQWYKFAVVREFNEFRVYLDDSIVASGTYTYSMAARSSLRVGDTRSGSEHHGFRGYIDDFKLTLGVARYK